MISSPEGNVKLRKEDEKKLELATQRLSVVQHEVLSATKELASLDGEITNARKSKIYLDEQVLITTAHLESLQNERQAVQLAVVEGNKDLDSLQGEHKKIKTVHSKKSSELDERESTVLQAEKDYAQKMLALTTREKQLETDRAEVENARNTFLDAIASVTWR